MQLTKFAFTILAFLVAFILLCEANKQAEFCNRRCLTIVNDVIAATGKLKQQGGTGYLLWNEFGSKVQRFCRNIKVDANKCSRFFGYVLQNAVNGESSWWICKDSKICLRHEMKKADEGKPKASCKICDAFKKSIDASAMHGVMSKLQKLALETCKNNQASSMKTVCKSVTKASLDDKMMMLMKPGLCEKYLCNTVTKQALSFLPKSEGACKLCQEILNISSSSASGIVNSVIQAVDNICEALPDEKKKEECLKVTSQVKETIDLILSRMKLSSLCKDLQICPGGKDDEPFFQVAKSFLATKSKSCKACKSVDKTSAAIGNYQHSVSEVQKYVNEACASVTDENLRRKCAMAKSALKVSSKTTSALNSRSCEALMCSGAAQLVKNIFPASKKSCQICNTVVKIVTDGLHGVSDMEKDILKQVDTICDAITNAASRKACHYAVSETGRIFSVVLKKLDPSGICKDLGFCETSAGNSQIEKNKEAGFLASLIRTSSASGEKSCPACDTLSKIERVAKMLINQQLSQIDATIGASCADATDKEKRECSKWQKLKNKLSGVSESDVSSKLCRKIACNSLTKKLMGFIPKSQQACKYCKLSMNITATAIKQSQFMVDQILDDVKQICNGIKPESSQKKCLDAIEKTKTIIAYVFKKLDFSDFCDSLGLCPGDKKNPYSQRAVAALQDSNAKTGKCTICDALRKFGKKKLSKLRKTVSKLEKIIWKGCRASSGARINQKCEKTSIAMLRNFDETKLISGWCEKHMCLDLPSRMTGDKKSCVLCKEIVKIVSTSLQYTEKLVDGILTSLEETCDSFKTSRARSECREALADTKIAVDKLLTELQAENVCKDLKFCPSKRRSAWLFTSKKSGPSDQRARKVWNIVGNVFGEISDMFG